MNFVEKITDAEDELLAIVVRAGYHEPGIRFFTNPNEFQQVAYISHRADKVIPAHTHNPIERSVIGTTEVLFIRKGRLVVDVYDNLKSLVRSVILFGGDVLILLRGGHGFRCVDNVEMFEVKQGPYAGVADKMGFEVKDVVVNANS